MPIVRMERRKVCVQIDHDSGKAGQLLQDDVMGRERMSCILKSLEEGCKKKKCWGHILNIKYSPYQKEVMYVILNI